MTLTCALFLLKHLFYFLLSKIDHIKHLYLCTALIPSFTNGHVPHLSTEVRKSLWFTVVHQFLLKWMACIIFFPCSEFVSKSHSTREKK